MIRGHLQILRSMSRGISRHNLSVLLSSATSQILTVFIIVRPRASPAAPSVPFAGASHVTRLRQQRDGQGDRRRVRCASPDGDHELSLSLASLREALADSGSPPPPTHRPVQASPHGIRRPATAVKTFVFFKVFKHDGNTKNKYAPTSQDRVGDPGCTRRSMERSCTWKEYLSLTTLIFGGQDRRVLQCWCATFTCSSTFNRTSMVKASKLNIVKVSKLKAWSWQLNLQPSLFANKAWKQQNQREILQMNSVKE